MKRKYGDMLHIDCSDLVAFAADCVLCPELRASPSLVLCWLVSWTCIRNILNVRFVLMWSCEADRMLTLSLGKRLIIVPNFEIIKAFPPLRVSKWKNFYRKAQYWKQICYRTIKKNTVCRRVCVHSAARKFLRAMAVKGLKSESSQLHPNICMKNGRR